MLVTWTRACELDAWSWMRPLENVQGWQRRQRHGGSGGSGSKAAAAA